MDLMYISMSRSTLCVTVTSQVGTSLDDLERRINELATQVERIFRAHRILQRHSRLFRELGELEREADRGAAHRTLPQRLRLIRQIEANAPRSRAARLELLRFGFSDGYMLNHEIQDIERKLETEIQGMNPRSDNRPILLQQRSQALRRNLQTVAQERNVNIERQPIGHRIANYLGPAFAPAVSMGDDFLFVLGVQAVAHVAMLLGIVRRTTGQGGDSGGQSGGSSGQVNVRVAQNVGEPTPQVAGARNPETQEETQPVEVENENRPPGRGQRVDRSSNIDAGLPALQGETTPESYYCRFPGDTDCIPVENSAPGLRWLLPQRQV